MRGITKEEALANSSGRLRFFLSGYEADLNALIHGSGDPL